MVRGTTFGLALLCASFLGQCEADNEYPIILMHGVTGWGRDELLGLKYWGGLNGDLQNIMKGRSGTEVFTVAMGPLSSNWDRVCEAFAQIKGTQVDYGAKHSQDYGISRYGRDYSSRGLYPQWGLINEQTGMRNKVHLLGHSMGGMDARLLTHFLNVGATNEGQNTGAEGDSMLFMGGNDWVASVTTLATPHDGSGAALVLEDANTLITGLVGFVAGGLGGQVGTGSDPLFDLKLDQFGLTRNNGESFNSYFGRVKKSALFDAGYKNTALWSLNPDGALQLNRWVECIDTVHYFSVGTSATFKSWFSKKYYPTATQIVVLWPFSTIIGRQTRRGDNRQTMNIDSTWWENDGVVSTKTADGPTGGTCKTEVYAGQTLENPNTKGKFLNIGVQKGWDHLDITGLGLRNVQDFYKSIQGWILGLQASKPEPCTTENGCDGAWPTPPKGSFALFPSAEEMKELVAGATDPGPSGDICKEIAEVCGGTVSADMVEVCKEIKAANIECDKASGAASLAPVFGLVLAFANLLW